MRSHAATLSTAGSTARTASTRRASSSIVAANAVTASSAPVSPHPATHGTDSPLTSSPTLAATRYVAVLCRLWSASRCVPGWRSRPVRGRVSVRVTDVIGCAGGDAAVEPEAKARRAELEDRVCWVRMLRSEVEVLSWSPDRGNPTLKRQGRGPGIDRAAPVRLVVRCGVSVRAGLEEAIGVSWWRTKVKRCKAFLGGRAGHAAAMPDSCRDRGRIGDAITTKSQRFTPGDLLGSGRVRPVGRRTRGRRLDGPAEVRGPCSTGRRGNAR